MDYDWISCVHHRGFNLVEFAEQKKIENMLRGGFRLPFLHIRGKEKED